MTLEEIKNEQKNINIATKEAYMIEDEEAREKRLDELMTKQVELGNKAIKATMGVTKRLKHLSDLSTKEVFIKQCKHYQLEYLMPNGAPT